MGGGGFGGIARVDDIDPFQLVALGHLALSQNFACCRCRSARRDGIRDAGSVFIILCRGFVNYLSLWRLSFVLLTPPLGVELRLLRNLGGFLCPCAPQRAFSVAKLSSRIAFFLGKADGWAFLDFSEKEVGPCGR